MLKIMVDFLTISCYISFSIFCILIIDIWNTNIVCVTAIVLIMGTHFVNKEEIVSGTRSEDSVTLSFLTASAHRECIYIFMKCQPGM